MANRSAPTKAFEPDALCIEARQFWDDITGAYQLRADELRLVKDACREIDLIERLDQALLNKPLTVRGSMGQTVANPLVSELRQHRATLAGLMKALKLEDVATPNKGSDGKPEASDTATAARTAAMAKWGRRG